MKLQDIQAPPWWCRIGSTSYRLKPLSLATFAEAEVVGLTLGRLSTATSAEPWVQLLALLTDHDPADESYVQEHLLPDVLCDPLGFERFRTQVAGSFDTGDAPHPAKKKGPRKVQRFKKPADPAEDPEPEQDETLDFEFLVDVSRSSGVSMADLMRMTFTGVTAVSKSLERIPPAGALGPAGLLGLLGGAGGPGKGPASGGGRR